MNLVRTLLALAALAGVAVPVAAAGDRPLQVKEDVTLDIYDSALSSACDANVFAAVSGTLERRIETGKGKRVAAREESSFRGRITWTNQDTGKTYASRLDSHTRVDYPEGIALFAPAHVTVSGTNGGTFPVGGGPPGHGTFEYEALVYFLSSDGLPEVVATSDPTWTGRGLDRATEKACAALS